MPDLTMCKGGECPQKNGCYRFRAIPDEGLQSYFLNPPFEKDKCGHFMSIEGWSYLSPIVEKKKKAMGLQARKKKKPIGLQNEESGKDGIGWCKRGVDDSPGRDTWRKKK